jgi:hypothetical protein
MITKGKAFSLLSMVLVIVLSCTTPQTVSSQSGNDYLKEGEVLASPDSGKDKWKIGTRLIACTIETEASSRTKGEYQVAYAYGTADWQKGQKHWTRLVITESHPATKDELKTGMLALATGSHPDRDDMRQAKWRVVRVSGLDNLYKGQVNIKKLNTFDGVITDGTCDVKSMRIIDSPDIRVR